MSKFPLDLKQFQKTGGDKNTTTLKHKNGHEIKVVHSALAPEIREKLKSLPTVETPKLQDEELPKAAPKALVDQKKEAKGENTKVTKEDTNSQNTEMKTYAKGGDIKGNPKLEQAHAPMPKMTPFEHHMRQALQHFFDGTNKGPIQAEPISDAEAYGDSQMERAPEEDFVPPASDARERQDDANVAAFRASNGNKALNLDEDQDLPANGGNGPKPAAINAAPQKGSAVSYGGDESQPANAPAPKAGQDPSQQDYLNPYKEGVEEEASGKQNEADALAQQAANERAALEQANVAAQQNTQIFQNKASAVAQQRQEAYTQLKNTPIDSNHYLNSRTTGQKIMQGIALVLGGVGGALTHQENPAMKFIQNQINNDIEGQKMELGKQNNLLAENYKTFGNVKDAADMTRVNLNDITARNLQIAASKSADPLVHARAQQAIGQLHAQSGMLAGKVHAQQVIQDPNATEADIHHALNAQRVYDPVAADSNSKRYMPGLGVADKDVPDQSRAQIVDNQNLVQRLNDLIKAQELYKRYASPEARAAVETQAHEAINFLAKSQDAGVITKDKQPILFEQIGNPNGFINDVLEDRARLKESLIGAQIRQNNLIKSFGFKSKGAQTYNHTGFRPKSFKPVK